MSKSDVGWYLDCYQRIYGLEKNKKMIKSDKWLSGGKGIESRETGVPRMEVVKRRDFTDLRETIFWVLILYW